MSHGARNSAKKPRQETRRVRFSLEEKSDKSDCQELFIPMVALILRDSNGELLKGVNFYLSNVILPIDAVPDESDFFKDSLAAKASNLPSAQAVRSRTLS